MCLPYADILRARFAKLLLDCIGPFGHVLTGEGRVFRFPGLVVEVRLGRLIVTVLSVLPHWILQLTRQQLAVHSHH